ncbi:ABC transporter ATP-binding protein [Pseudonocardia sp. WMMC193]|uniref:ABC transporter ATP-binding protein n=1 Tax=Pseudonocardia sp. WMMC193 TaxID=2911965 RepID=UPI001F47D8A0|nr:ABC transporter ATP-binding protein [Pseudonocardia sp. WMMC193]MCF7551546.1 ABC transporter ATP-binding protein [Pseudonocardia sp. WMMC193]
MPEPLLSVRGLTVRYGSVTAVHGIDLDVAEGELVALVGPNGAGKSSTLAAITGAVRPARGTVALGGEVLSGLAPEKVVRRGVALVPEGRHVFTGLSVAENLALGATIRRSGVAEDLERELERFPILRERYRQQAGLLSGGEQQQLAIARALMSRPRLLLLDEPSLGLAPKIVDLVFETVARLRREGLTIVLVEQNATRAVELADRTSVLRTGRIVRSGTAAELGGAAAMAAEYLGEAV